MANLPAKTLGECITAAILAVKLRDRDEVRGEVERGVRDAMAHFEKEFGDERKVLCSPKNATRSLLEAISESFQVSGSDVFSDMPENVAGLILSHMSVQTLCQWSRVSKGFQRSAKAGLKTAPAFSMNRCDWDDGAPTVSNFSLALPQLEFVGKHCPNLRSLNVHWGMLADYDEGGQVTSKDRDLYQRGLEILNNNFKKLERLCFEYPDNTFIEGHPLERGYFDVPAFTVGFPKLRVLELTWQNAKQMWNELSGESGLCNLPAIQMLKLCLNDGKYPQKLLAELISSCSATLEVCSVEMMEGEVSNFLESLQETRFEKLRVLDLDFCGNQDVDNAKWVRLWKLCFATLEKIANPERIEGLHMELGDTLTIADDIFELYKSIIIEAGSKFPNVRWFGNVSMEYDAYHRPGPIKTALQDGSVAQLIKENLPHLEFLSTDTDADELKVPQKSFKLSFSMDVYMVMKTFLGLR